MSLPHVTLGEPGEDAVPQQPPPVSRAMAAKLTKLGMWDMYGWLCGPMSLRSLGAVARLLDHEFFHICCTALAANFTFGHVATLRALRSEAAAYVASEALPLYKPLLAQVDVLNPWESVEAAVAAVNMDCVPAPPRPLPAEAATKSEEARRALEVAEEAFECWRRGCSSVPTDSAVEPLVHVLQEAILDPLTSSRAHHRATRGSLTEQAACELAGALDCLDGALHDWEVATAQEPILDALLQCCYDAMHIAKKATQDALLHCFCEDMNAEVHANTKLAKKIVQEKCSEAFGRRVSDHVLSRLQNARHQLFIRKGGPAQPRLFDISISDKTGFSTREESHCLRIDSIEIDCAIHQWNVQHAERRVEVGDRIVRVDGHWGEATDLEATLRANEGAADLLVLRNARSAKKTDKKKSRKESLGYF